MSIASLSGSIPGAAYTVPLFETASSGDSRVDPEKGVIYGVKVLGFRSRATGRTIGLDPREFGDAVDQHYSYTRQAMLDALPLYEGVRVYIDHPEFKYRPDGERIASLRDRNLEEVFGRLVNVRVGETGMFADLEYVKSHPLAAQVVEMAIRFPDLLALSHNAHGDPVLENGQVVINHISGVRSVDLVGEKPGTTHSLFETGPRNMADALGTPEPPVVGNTTEQIATAKYGGDTHMHEDEPGMLPPSDMRTPEAAPDAGPAPDHFDSAFQTEIMNIVQGDGTAQDKIGKISGLLKLQDKVGAIRGGGDDDDGGDEPSVGADLDETDPEPPAAGDKDKTKVAEDAPPPAADKDKTKVTESAPKVIEVVPNKAKIMTELLETIVCPTLDLMNAKAVPITSAALSAAVRTPSKRRAALVETWAHPAPRAVASAPRSQAGAVGLQETNPAAAARRQAAAAPAPQGKGYLKMSSDEIWEKLNGGR